MGRLVLLFLFQWPLGPWGCGDLERAGQGAAIAAKKALITCNDGALVQLEKADQGWTLTTLEKHAKALCGPLPPVADLALGN